MKKIILLSALLGAALFARAAVRQPIYAQGPTTILVSNLVTTADGSVTQAFPSSLTFTNPPFILVSQRGVVNSVTNIITITTTNFIYRSSVPSQTNAWIAIGTPQ